MPSSLVPAIGRVPVILLLLITVHRCRAQDPRLEFPKGWRFPLELSQGSVGPQQAYAGSLQVGALWTICPGHMRIGPVAGMLSSHGTIDAMGGARLAYKLKEILVPLDSTGSPMGSLGNVQLQVDGFLTTDHYALLGGGVQVELNLLLLGLRGYVALPETGDAHPGQWQLSIGVDLKQLFRKKPKPDGGRTIDEPVIH